MHRILPSWPAKTFIRKAFANPAGRDLFHTIGSKATTDKIPRYFGFLPVPTESTCLRCCQLQAAANFHTSQKLSGGKIKNTKKKLIKKITFAKKSSNKRSWDVIPIRPNMTVSELAEVINKDCDHVFEALVYIKDTDQYDTPSAVITDFNVIKQVLDKSGFRWKIQEKTSSVVKENKDAVKRPPPEPDGLQPRPPVVTIMGHVDHGKTTLLDALRKSNIVAKEFGGITQHIGAFSVTMASGDTITFLDTPGHAAFSAMRARGAGVTDIIILVIAAEDGVMQQTIESIRHAREADVPVIVAINKIDKYEADVERTKQMLTQSGITLEDYGGEVQVVPISALKGTNLDQLQEAVVTLAELMELTCDPTGAVEGTVIEAKTDPGKGKLSTVIVQRGTLKKGACLVAGKAWAKVRNMHDDRGQVQTVVPPGFAVEVTGWKTLPSAGDTVLQVESEARAREVVSWREEKDKLLQASEDLNLIQEKQESHQKEYEVLRQERLDRGHRRGAIYSRRRTKEAIESNTGPGLAIVLKGDVDGSVEAITDILGTYDSDQCQLQLLQYGVGIVSEQDVEMAASFDGHIFAFNVDIPAKVEDLARENNVAVHHHNVIYKLIDDLKLEINKRIPPSEKEEIVGEANVLQRFLISEGRRKTPVAGCRCVKGMLQKAKQFRLVRDGVPVLEGSLSSLRHFKEEVACIQQNQECGLVFSDTSIEPEPGDVIVCYDLVHVQEDVQWDLNF